MTIRITDPTPKTYMVLGMHQGGTSIVSKALHDQGIDMGISGELTYEDNDFVNMNNKLIASAGGSWMTIPKKENIATAIRGHAGNIKILLDKKRKDKWGWKDPRTALVAEAYLPHLGDDPYIIAIFRKPSKVAESLERRDQYKNGKILAKQYYERILEVIKDFIDE